MDCMALQNDCQPPPFCPSQTSHNRSTIVSAFVYWITIFTFSLVVSLKDFGKSFLHLPSFIHMQLGLRVPQVRTFLRLDQFELFSRTQIKALDLLSVLRATRTTYLNSSLRYVYLSEGKLQKCESR